MRPNETRKCPFCSKQFTLGNCKVISAVTPESSPFSGDGEEAATDYRVLEQPPNGRKQGFLAAPPPMRRPDATWSPHLIPRRQCPQPACGKPLPLEIDDCQVVELAVVGLNRAGKTYWIGSAFTRATRTDDLAGFGIERITPLEDTGETLHRDYYLPLFRNSQHELPFTLEDHHLHEPPLLFEVKMQDAPPFILVVRDVSGDVLVKRQRRLQKAEFVTSADGLIFVLDPKDMYRIADDLYEADDDTAERNINQVSLLEAILRESSRQRPLGIVVSKGDLIEELMPGRTPLVLPPAGDWRRSLKEHSDAVRQLLQDLGETRLVTLADSVPKVSYHMSSVLGLTEVRRRRGGRPASMGVLEPLAVVLTRMCQ